jgi:MoxR-like ATPase
LTEPLSDPGTGNAIRTLAEKLREQLLKRIFGLEAEMGLLMAAVVAGRHVLMEGVPGLGKTLLLKTLADALGCVFRRIQFTPDLLPADILGGYVYDSRDASFKLREGPIFANVILADEINRAPAKTQSALLEVMQEGQVTIEGESLPMPKPFFVFATQNPLEHEGVYPLPQAQLAASPCGSCSSTRAPPRSRTSSPHIESPSRRSAR